jgi:hypothetical protein
MICTQGKDGNKFSIWQISFGDNGYTNTCLGYKNDKNFYPRRNFAVNDVVLIVDQSSPCNTWPLGRIMQVFPDKKGFVRRVAVKTSMSILERPISKLCLLESV